MSYRNDRELPGMQARGARSAQSYKQQILTVRLVADPSIHSFRWRYTLPWFLAFLGLSSYAIANHNKSSSPAVAAMMYALRTSPRAREALGDEIYFANAIPWIHGSMNQFHGKMDVWFSVRGTRAPAKMRFRSQRPRAKAAYETLEWTLEMEDGSKIDLLQEKGDVFVGTYGGIEDL
jgi:cytochrome c oxidase assembly factor 1